jgi:hypothetical protein
MVIEWLNRIDPGTHRRIKGLLISCGLSTAIGAVFRTVQKTVLKEKDPSGRGADWHRGRSCVRHPL